MPATVSVVVTTFNRSRLVVNAIESVFAQTYKDYELIVVDDGSTDDTAHTLGPYTDRIRYFYQENRGASAAQNRGIALATGQWISFLASDDLWLPTKLERQFHALTVLGDAFGACFTDCSYEGNPDLTLTAFQEAGFRIDSEFGACDDPITLIFPAPQPIIYVQSLLVRRQLLEELGGFDEGLLVSEDTDLLFRLAFKTRFCFVSAPLVKIDRTPSVPRLMGLFQERSDRLFACIEHRNHKWLQLPELVDVRTRRKIQQSLLGLYYDWTIANLYQRRFRMALKHASRVRSMGDGYVIIATTLIFRIIRKLYSRLVASSFGKRTAKRGVRH